MKRREGGSAPVPMRMIVTPGRISFQAHRGTLDTRVYLLRATGQGPRLRPAAADAPTTDDWRQLRVPVLDRTGLEGDFAFTVEWPAEPPRAGQDPPTPPAVPTPSEHTNDLFGWAGMGALREQLGLSLESARAPIDILVIDTVREATEN